MKRFTLAIASTGLQRRLLVLLVVALLPVVGFVIHTSMRDQDESLSLAGSNLQTVAQLSALGTSRTIEGTRQLLGVIASGPSLKGIGLDKLCSEFLGNIRNTYPIYLNVGFLDAEGKILCNALPTNPSGNFADRAYFQQAIATRSFAIGEYQIGRITGRAAINFGMPVFDNQGALKGVAFAALDLEQLAVDLKIATPPNVSVTVTDRNGIIVATDIAQSGRVGSRYPDAALYSAMKTLPAVITGASDSNGIERLYSVVAVGASSQGGLFVIASIAREAVTAPARRELFLALLLFTLWATLGIAAARWIGNRTVVTPTRRLLGEINGLAGNNAAHALAPRTNVNEIEALSSAFHHLAGILKLREAERESSGAELRETQVRLLTAQRIGKIGNWEFDSAARRLWWSEQTYAIFEQTPQAFTVTIESLAGQVFPEDRERYEAALRHLSVGNAFDIEHRIVTGTGRVRWVHELGEMRLGEQGRPVTSGTVQDITDRVRSERLLASEARALKALSLGLPLKTVLEEVLRGVETILPGALACVNVLSPDGSRLQSGAGPSLPQAWNQAFDGLLIGPSTGSRGTDAYRREPVIVPDIESDPLWAEYRDLARQHGLRACWSLPVQDPKGQVLATFAIYHRAPHAPDQEELALAQGAASVIGIAIEREMKDAALRASEQRFRDTFAGAATGMTITTLAGNYVEVNEAYCRMFGYTQEELIGRDIKSFIHPDDRSKYSGEMRELEEGTGASYISERRFLVKDSRIVWIRSSVSALRDASGKTVARSAIAEDITLQREAEEALLKTQRLLGMASRISRQGAWKVDLPDLQPTWSEEVYAIHELPTGVTPSVAESINYYAPEYRDTVRELFENCVSSGTPFDAELQIITGKGRRIWVRALGEAVRDPSGAIVQVQGAFQDITQKRKAAEQLLLLQTAVSRLNDVVMITEATHIDGLGLNIVFVNDAFERLTGYKRHEVMGKAPLILQGTTNQRTELDRIRAALEKGESVRAELIDHTKAGDAYWVEFEIVPIADEQGSLTHFVAIERDVTERKRAEEKILQLNAELEDRVKRRTVQLEAANRELEAFSYSVSHDLRSPLNTIDGFGQMLLKSNGSNLDDKGQHYLRRIRAGTQQMGELIDGLLLLAKLSRDPIRLEWVDISAIFRRIEQEFREREPERQVQVQVQDALLVRGDAVLLSVVVQNLLGNAWKFSARREAAKIEIGSEAAADGQTVYFVRDNGAGFDMAYADKLFGVFQRLHSTTDFAGTGVGWRM